MSTTCVPTTPSLCTVIDTHSHLLPGLDDGASSLEESVQLARAALDSGVTDVVCTPHLRGPSDRAALEAAAVLEEVRSVLADTGIPLRLHLGYEITFSFAMEMDVEALRTYSLGGKSCAVLIEVPYEGWPSHAEDAVFRWRLAGLWPVLAHPERNMRAQKNPALIAALVSLGASVQATAPSIMGHFGQSARRVLLSLIEQGHASLLASDAHSPRSRAATLGQAVRELRRLAPRADIVRMTRVNPERVLRGEAVLPLDPITVPNRWENFLGKITRRVP